MRSRAFTAGCPGRACVLKYACQARFPEPTAIASVWQCASAPASPPRLPPSPMGALVTKKLILGEGFSPRGYSPGLWTCASNRQDASETVQDNSRAEVLILVMDRSKCERRITQKAAGAKRVTARPPGALSPSYATSGPLLVALTIRTSPGKLIPCVVE